MTELKEYLKLAKDTVSLFNEGILYVLENDIDDHFRQLAKKTHKLESNADDIRRQIETDLFEKSLLPETRHDLLIILEALDRIPNKAEFILNIIVNQNMKPIKLLHRKIKELLIISVETFSLVEDATWDCFNRAEKTREYNRLIDNNESLGDSLEREMISALFQDNSIDLGTKILQKELIVEMGAICDLCERAMDNIVICSIKRSI